jgi:uncharacterized protein (TIGR00251 family)
LTLRLTMTVSPGAKRSAIVGAHGDGWRVRIAAPPERGRANDALVELLSAALGAPVRLVGGHTSRRKVVEVDGLTEEEAGRRLDAAARNAS